MHRKQPTASEDLEIYAPLTPEELERSRKNLAKRRGRFGHRIQIDLPFTREDITNGRVRLGSDYYFEGEQRADRDPIEWVEATPTGLARWLAAPERKGTIGEFMPFGLAAIVLSFYHRGFSPREIHEALEPVADKGQRHLLMPADPGWRLSPPRPDLMRRDLGCWSRT